MEDRGGGEGEAGKTFERIAAVSSVYYSIHFYNLSQINPLANVLYKSHQLKLDKAE